KEKLACIFVGRLYRLPPVCGRPCGNGGGVETGAAVYGEKQFPFLAALFAGMVYGHRLLLGEGGRRKGGEGGHNKARELCLGDVNLCPCRRPVLFLWRETVPNQIGIEHATPLQYHRVAHLHCPGRGYGSGVEGQERLADWRVR